MPTKKPKSLSAIVWLFEAVTVELKRSEKLIRPAIPKKIVKAKLGFFLNLYSNLFICETRKKVHKENPIPTAPLAILSVTVLDKTGSKIPINPCKATTAINKVQPIRGTWAGLVTFLDLNFINPSLNLLPMSKT